MKSCFVFLFLLLFQPLGMAADGGTVFRNLTFEDALKAARVEHKRVFVDCYTAWCVPCARMTKEVFTEKECGDAMNDRLVSVKIDMEKGEGVALGKRLGITSYPTFIIFNADGSEVNRIVGASASAADFVRKLEQALDPANSPAALERSYAETHDFDTGMKLVETMMANNMDARAALREVFDNGHEFERYQERVLQYALAVADYRDPLFDHLMEYKPYFDSNVGAERVNRVIFDSYRKGMYQVCAGRDHDYSAEDVRKAVLLTSLLRMPTDKPEVHLIHIASFVIEKDWDGMLDYYSRFVASLPHNDSFRGIVDGFIPTHIGKMTQEQRAKAKKYFEDCARNLLYESRQAENAINVIENIK
ncbi:MAG: thioredoxin family protein [Prevotella sp.]|nr:thioredoxin family protein [Prevotella sp.]